MKQRIKIFLAGGVLALALIGTAAAASYDDGIAAYQLGDYETAARLWRTEATPTPARATSRAGLKHIGGYFDRIDVEKIAVLRARLGLNNSQLIRLAVDELYKKHEAKRAFGDS